jgi:histidinol phosphatase-like enzyme
VIEAAWSQGVPARCVWLQTSLEDAQVNVVQRMITRHGRLLDPDEMRRASRDDPGVIAPGVLFRHRRELEPPELSEGFTRIDTVPFVRPPRPGFEGRAVLFWYDGVVRTSRTGARTPRSPDDVVLVPGAREVLARHRDEGWRLCGVSWHPEVAGETMRADEVEAVFARTHELLGLAIDHAWCPHGDGAPVCWCRKPLPGLGVVMIERHRLDPRRCRYLGTGGPDRAFAHALGLTYVDGLAGCGRYSVRMTGGGFPVRPCAPCPGSAWRPWRGRPSRHAPEETFDRLTPRRPAPRRPSTFISGRRARDFYKSCVGFGEPLASARQLEGGTFCHYAIVSDGPLVIDDTTVDPVFRAVPTVTSLGVRAYAGIPLVTDDGDAIGSFCAIDFKPRAWSELDVEILTELAHAAMREIKMRFALEDTGRALREAQDRPAGRGAGRDHARPAHSLGVITMNVHSWRPRPRPSR